MENDRREPLVFTVNQARRLLCLSRGLMYEAVRTGEVPSIRIGRRILIPRVALKRLLEQQIKTEPNGEQTK